MKSTHWLRSITAYMEIIAGRRVYTRGLSRLPDQGKMVAMSGGSRPNQFCKCVIVGLLTTLWCTILIWQPLTRGELTLLGCGEEIFSGGPDEPPNTPHHSVGRRKSRLGVAGWITPSLRQPFVGIVYFTSRPLTDILNIGTGFDIAGMWSRSRQVSRRTNVSSRSRPFSSCAQRKQLSARLCMPNHKTSQFNRRC